MSSEVGKIYFSIVARSRCGRSPNALSKSSRPRVSGAVEQDWVVHNIWSAGAAGHSPRSDLGLWPDAHDCANGGVGDLSFEGVGVEAE